MENLNLTFNEAREICENAFNFTLESKELTYGSNGYPEFNGVRRYAYFGFYDFAEAKELAAECHGTIEQVAWRDGWTLAKSDGIVNFPMAIDVEQDYGNNYNVWTPEQEFPSLIERISDCHSIDEIEAQVKKYTEIDSEYFAKEDDELIIVRDGEYYETIKERPLSWSHDTKNYAIAVVINSKDYPDV